MSSAESPRDKLTLEYFSERDVQGVRELADLMRALDGLEVECAGAQVHQGSVQLTIRVPSKPGVDRMIEVANIFERAPFSLCAIVTKLTGGAS